MTKILRARRDPARATNKPTKKRFSHGRLCVCLIEVPERSDQRKQVIFEKATIPVTAAPPNRRPSVILMEERFWRPIPKAERYESHLKPLSKHAQNILRLEPQVRETDGAEKWAKSRQIMIEKFPYVHSWNFDTWLEMLTRASKVS